MRSWLCRAAMAWALVGGGVALAASPGDPLKSANWDDLRQRFFGDAKVVFDDRVKVTAPARAEDSMNVPAAAVSLSGNSPGST